MSPVTEKQHLFIVAIQSMTGTIFEGSTKKEAAEYISANIEEYRRLRYLEEEYEFMRDHPEHY